MFLLSLSIKPDINEIKRDNQIAKMTQFYIGLCSKFCWISFEFNKTKLKWCYIMIASGF